METVHKVKFLHSVILCGVIKYVELFTMEVIEVIMINSATKCLCSPSSWLISQLSTTEGLLSCQGFEHFRWGHADIKNCWWTFEKSSDTFLSSTETDQHENLRQAVVRKRWGFGGEGDDKFSELTIGSCVSVRSSRYEARRKFGGHERCVRIARGVAESNSSLLSALQTS